MYFTTILTSLLAVSLVSAAAAPAPPPGYGKPKPKPKPTKTKSSAVVSPTPSLTCEQQYCETVCIQVFPESCYCENAAKKSCFENCGGPKPTYQSCPPLSSSTSASVAY